MNCASQTRPLTLEKQSEQRQLMKVLLVLVSLSALINSSRCLQDDAKDADLGPNSMGEGPLRSPKVVDEANTQSMDSVQDELKDKRSAHDKRMDQEALVGGAGVWKSFHELSTEEASKQIKRLVEAIDKDRDDSVSKEELARWLRISGERAGKEETRRTFLREDTDKDGRLSFKEFHEGSKSTGPAEADEELDRIKFSDADLDKDGYLSMEELRTLVMPTYHAHILEHLVTERLRRYDNNRDGFINMDEYIGVPSDESSDRKWREREKSDFARLMDMNRDGQLDRDEVKMWLLSEEAEFLDEEAEHLIQSADKNQDGQLSIEEIFAELDVFLDGVPSSRFEQHTHEEL